MRVEELIRILEERRKLHPPVKQTLTKNQLDYIRFKGISDEDIVNHVVPQIIQWEIEGSYSKKSVNDFLEVRSISILPDPVRHEIDKSVGQRRMDSLSRLLSIDNHISPCVAVTCYDGKLIVSSNSPMGKTKDELGDYFNKKLHIIRRFLSRLAKDANIDEGSGDTVKIEFSVLAQILVERAVSELVKEENGGVGDIVPSGAHRHPNRNNIKQHLRVALLKLGQSYLLGLYTQGKRGLSQQELQAFSDTTDVIMVTPVKEVLGDQQLHAEQAILYYLRHFTDFETDSTQTVNIGISKLCCAACLNVLSKAEKIAFRGTHGMPFPNVYDIDTDSVYHAPATKMGREACPSDSESECELYEDESDTEVNVDEFKMALLDELLSTPTKKQAFAGEDMGAIDRLRLFKPKVEIKHTAQPSSTNMESICS